MKYSRLITVLVFAALLLLLSFLVASVTSCSPTPEMTQPTTVVPPTLPTTDQIILAVFVLGSALIVAILTRRSSIKTLMQRQKDAWLQHGIIPEHGLIDYSASLSANVVCVLWCALGAYLAVAILSGDLLWLPALFH